ncbi:MAG: DUF1080 domain-containing protein [Planctomycetaceae bacterium]|nr:DUF1080 domain-containing protein [Planctomycetaceae bacterium]
MPLSRRKLIVGLGLLVSSGGRWSSLHAEPQDKQPESNATTGKPIELFDGKTLTGWKISDYAGHGDVTVKDGAIHCDTGEHLSGIATTRDKELPKMNYEISLEAMRVDGGDFFCGLTFPVGKSACSFIVGGWGGTVTGISSLDGQDASENDTTGGSFFDNKRWYRIRTRVTPNRIQCWIDKERVVNVDTTDREISIRIGVEPSLPWGLATWQTAAAWRKIQVASVTGPE